MNPQKSVCLLEVLQGGTDFLQKNRIEQPRLHVEYLLAHVLGIPRLELYLQFDRFLEERELAPLRLYLRERSKGVPLQHLLGSVDFFGRNFLSDARALIPRPETEELIERALTYKKTKRILDVGTGSGVIAITLGLENPEAEIDAIDLSSQALDLAEKNAQRHEVTRIRWHCGNLLEPLEKIKSIRPFDLIIANLPYIPHNDIRSLAREIAFDPIMALDGGESGLDLINELISQSPKFLQPGGHLLLEIGKNQEQEVMQALREHHYQEICVLPDHQGVLRFIEAVQP